MLAIALPGAIAASLGVSATAGAASSGVFAVQSTDIQGQQIIAPGDWISVGYDFQLSGNHAVNNAQFYFQSATATLQLGCSSRSAAWTLNIPMWQGPYTVAQSNNNWVPTDQASSNQVYQGAAQVPNFTCSGGHGHNRNQLQVVNGGVSFNATVTSPNDTRDQLQVRFHAWDANANSDRAGNVDCASSSQNPITNSQNLQGIGACDSGWAPNAPRATAASRGSPGPPPTPSPKPTQQPPSTGSHSTSHPGQPNAPPAVVPRPGSLAGSSSPAVPGSVANPGFPQSFIPTSIAPSPTAEPLVIGSGGPVGAAPLLIAISTNWLPLIVVLALLLMVLLALALTSRRRRRTDLPTPVAGHF